MKLASLAGTKTYLLTKTELSINIDKIISNRALCLLFYIINANHIHIMIWIEENVEGCFQHF